MFRRATALPAAVALLFAAGELAASNRFQNGEFDVDAASWGIFTGNGPIMVPDANGCAASKAASAWATNDEDLPMGVLTVRFYQCVALGSPAPAELHASFAHRSSVTDLLGKVGFYAGSGCALETFLSESVSELDHVLDFSVWQASTFGVEVPEGAVSALVRIAFEKESFGYAVRVDSAVLGEAEPIFFGGFENGTTCPWALGPEPE